MNLFLKVESKGGFVLKIETFLNTKYNTTQEE